MLYRVSDLYKYAKQNGKKLLSEHDADYWEAYKANSKVFDNLFYKLFKSFLWDADILDQIDAAFADFVFDVECYLTANDKKYSELYRVEVIPDEDYSIVNNYDMTETMQRVNDRTGTSTDAEHTDNITRNYGKLSETTTTNLGAQANTEVVEHGEQTENVNANTGEHTDTAKHSVAPFDSAELSIDEQTATVYGAQDTTSGTTRTAYTDTTSTNLGAQENTESRTRDARADDEISDYGERTRTDKGMENENYTLKRAGNIGVMTQTEVMRQHADFWRAYSFYIDIFNDLRDYMLLVN